MISVWPRSCDISGNSSLPKGYETDAQMFRKVRLEVNIEGGGM